MSTVLLPQEIANIIKAFSSREVEIIIFIVDLVLINKLIRIFKTQIIMLSSLRSVAYLLNRKVNKVPFRKLQFKMILIFSTKLSKNLLLYHKEYREQLTLILLQIVSYLRIKVV